MPNTRNFLKWLETFRPSINSYKYYTDFEKVYKNIAKLKIEINILNSLIGSKNIDAEFENILAKYPECLKVIPLLLAVRKSEIFCQDERGAFEYNFDDKNYSVAQYKYFMRQTGIFELLENNHIKNLQDYLTGVEVGLDSNGRKNRGGHQMENLVEKFLIKSGVNYFKEMKLSEIEVRWNVNLAAISARGTTEKRWDFVIKTAENIFVIETNFYAEGGSKLNETARSYKMIAEESKNIPNFKFVWITDGGGWKSARRNLQETFLTLETLYNIQDLENGIFKELFAK